MLIRLQFTDTGDGTVYKPISLIDLATRLNGNEERVLVAENGDYCSSYEFIDVLKAGELDCEIIKDDGLAVVTCSRCYETMVVPSEEASDAECWLCGSPCEEAE